MSDSVTAIMRRQVREMMAIENRTVRATRRILARQQNKIVRNALQGRFEIDVNPLFNLISDAMYYGHLLGMYRAELQRRRQSSFQLSQNEFQKNIRDLERRLKLNPRSTVKRTYEGLASSALAELQSNWRRRVQATVNEVVAQGMPPRKAAKVLRDAFPKDVSVGQIETIVRTQSQLSYNAGKWEEAARFEAEDPDLWGYKYLTANDERVRPGHAALHGVTLPKDDPLWNEIWPPNGWNCRCQVVALYEKERIRRPRKGWFVDSEFRFNPMQLV